MQATMKRKMKISYKLGSYNEVPMIRIANKYLKNYGFNIGDIAEIEYKPNELVIKKVGVRNKLNKNKTSNGQ